MPKTFYTERDIQELAGRGVTEVAVNDDVVITDLGRDMALKLGLERGLSVALFPMVILTMTIERLSITWEERGGGHAMKVAIGTLFAATLAYLVMSVPELVYFVFTFPAILLILVGFMLAMGRYRGYRLTELVRFKAFLKADS